MLHFNCRSLIKHLEDKETFINKVESPPHLIALTETWLRVDDEPSCYLVNNFTKCLVSSRKSRGAGVMLQFCEDVILIRELQCPFDGSLMAQYSNFRQVYIVIVIYSPPGIDKMVFVEHFELFLESLGSYKCPMVVSVDLNIDSLKSKMLKGKYLDIVQGNGYMILSTDATRVTHQSSTCTDHVIIRNNENYEFSVMQECFSDHYPLSLSCRQKSVAKSERVVYRNTAFLRNCMKIVKLNFVLLDKLSRFDCSLPFNSTMRHFFWKFWMKLDLQESRKRKMVKPAWLTKGLKNLISKRNQADKEWLRNGENESL